MASLIYNSALNDALNGDIDFGADTFRVMLTTSSYTPNKDTHNRRDDVTDEVVGSGYTADGEIVTVTVTNDTANDRQNVSLGAASWPTSTITARRAVYYKALGGAASADPLVAVIDFGTDVISTSGTFSLTASTLRIQN